jgi:nucleoside-diphosphate-sugar epimerase
MNRCEPGWIIDGGQHQLTLQLLGLVRRRIVKKLITGNMGYVGPSVAKYLRNARPDAILHGFDNAYFAHCLTGAPVFPERDLDEQFYGDVRAIPLDMMSGYDAVVQLAAISNDPIGNQFEDVTFDINQNTRISIAKAATKAGKNFVFASSCSVYGIVHGPSREKRLIRLIRSRPMPNPKSAQSESWRKSTRTW